MSDDLIAIARLRVDGPICTHWESCEREHRECLIQKLANELEAARKRIAELEETERDLRRHIEKRASGVDPLAVYLREKAERAEAELAAAKADADDATDNAARVILHMVLPEQDWDEFIAWYKPEQWLGIHRAVGAFIRMKMDAVRAALSGLLARHNDGGDERYWAEWDAAIDAARAKEQ